MRIVADIQEILRQAQQLAVRHINTAMLSAYWQVGRRIVEEEQQGESRAAYGKALIKNLSEELQKEFGKGFSVNNLQNMRLFYMSYPIQQTLSANLEGDAILQTQLADSIPSSISETLSRKLQVPDFQLSWSHYQMLMRIDDAAERSFYEIEAARNQWSLRELKRQYDSALYLRLALSKDKEGIKALAGEGGMISTAGDLDKWMYCLHNGKLLADSSYRAMTAHAVSRTHRWGALKYADGIQVDSLDDMPELSMSGYVPGFISTIIYYPATRISMVVLENISPSSSDMSRAFYFHDQIRKIVRASF